MLASRPDTGKPPPGAVYDREVPLRAILFDAGNTLIQMDYAAMARRLARHGVTVGAAAVRRAEWRARVQLDEEVLAEGRPRVSTESPSTAERYLALVLAHLGVHDAATVAAVAAWRRTYNPPLGVWTAPAPGAARALARVRAAGLRAGVVSNSDGTVAAILASLGLAPALDFVIDSGEVGVEKPDPEIFRLALARAGVAAAEAVYVGDLYSVDVRGARAAGIEAILLDPGRYWGPRDCRRARDVDAAVRLALAPATRAASRRGSGEAPRR